MLTESEYTIEEAFDRLARRNMDGEQIEDAIDGYIDKHGADALLLSIIVVFENRAKQGREDLPNLNRLAKAASVILSHEAPSRFTDFTADELIIITGALAREMWKISGTRTTDDLKTGDDKQAQDYRCVSRISVDAIFALDAKRRVLNDDDYPEPDTQSHTRLCACGDELCMGGRSEYCD